MSASIYHEKQVKELCALHALNNLFQREDAFLKTELDAICHSLTPEVWLNPHKSVLGRGNYDVNVVIAALQNKGYRAIWFDKRKRVNCLVLDKIFGYILNIPNGYHIGYIKLPLQRRHWFAVRKIKNKFYNLDSKLKEPAIIGDDSLFLAFLQEKLKDNQTQLFIVIAADTKDWFSGEPVVDEKNHSIY